MLLGKRLGRRAQQLVEGAVQLADPLSNESPQRLRVPSLAEEPEPEVGVLVRGRDALSLCCLTLRVAWPSLSPRSQSI